MTSANQVTSTRPLTPGLITGVIPGSAAERIGIRPGDELLAVNDHQCEDVIDVQYYAAEEWLDLRIRRDGEEMILSGVRDYDQELGLGFKHPTFDIDIRRCNNLCEFCFVLQMAPKMRRTLYIKDDDYRYSFLFGHFVTLTNLTEHDWNRLIEQHLSPLYVSVHATDLEVRRKCLRNPTAPDIMKQLGELTDLNFEIHTQLVITPGVNDGAYMEQSIRDLATLWPTVRSISVVPVGLTRYHKYGLETSSRAHAESVLEVCELFQRQFRAEMGIGFVYPTDEWYLVTEHDLPPLDQYDDLALHENGLGMVRSFLDEWALVKREELSAFTPKVRHVTLATATLFAPTLERTAAELSVSSGLRINVQAITNTRLGETITVSGLLMGEDVIAQLKPLVESGDLGDLIVLPRIMFDHPDGVCLDDKSPMDIARALNRPVALADLMGDVLDAAMGKNKLTFDPTVIGQNIPIVRDGGWAVEKYL